MLAAQSKKSLPVSEQKAKWKTKLVLKNENATQKIFVVVHFEAIVKVSLIRANIKGD